MKEQQQYQKDLYATIREEKMKKYQGGNDYNISGYK